MKYLPILLLLSFYSIAQDKSLPYYQIPPYPETFTAGTVAARMVDGLGFRFYWATEGLRKEDLDYKPGADARTCLQTIEHIYGMSLIILTSTTYTMNVTQSPPSLSFEDMRKQTLLNLKSASDKLRTFSDEEMNNKRIIFQRGNGKIEYPFWNQINGPIADCLWHVGQVVSFRRASGNPFTDRVSLLTGEVVK